MDDIERVKLEQDRRTLARREIQVERHEPLPGQGSLLPPERTTMRLGGRWKSYEESTELVLMTCATLIADGTYPSAARIAKATGLRLNLICEIRNKLIAAGRLVIPRTLWPVCRQLPSAMKED